MKDEIVLNVAEEFSKFPTGRVPEDGSNSGQRFRQDFLRPRLIEAIRSDAKLVVSLDNLETCGSSFLEESFGGLFRDECFRKKGFTFEQIKKHLKVSATQRGMLRYVRSAEKHIEKASR
ncbi:hypothetical protein BVC71_00355 [Marivivens niveibacter]|uniref:DUF4325 domain-containing protein n=1 Tax=Marivivens niveibacter TaxID=1930667 RepID=A0A251WZU9_9RHOB|nr:STAS-like domain-containing protein [Marivivens niveibacter]OUD10009.1 hypothetical protein BVC71_00355 [Marivivens niveibacter]